MSDEEREFLRALADAITSGRNVRDDGHCINAAFELIKLPAYARRSGTHPQEDAP